MSAQVDLREGHCRLLAAPGGRGRAAALQALTAALAVALAAAGSSRAADPPAPDARLARDLFSVLALRGKPCGKVVEVQRQAEEDYLVRCEDGHRYRIRSQGQKVVIEER